MALDVKYRKIIGEIDNLEEKLNGEIPIDRLELLYLINSHGRISFFSTNENIKINQCEAKECYDLSKLDTSEITDMNSLFKYSMFNDIHSTNGIGLHNGDISNWDVSNVIDVSAMFANAYKFNQSLNDWDVSKVTYMNGMFYEAKEFNQDINNWDVSNVIDMNGMFSSTSFNQALDNWNVSNVRDMSRMFGSSYKFNQDINNWDVSNVTDMELMFYNANNFNQALNSWNVSSVKYMYNMFQEAKEFNQALNNWDVSNVTDMNKMFDKAIAFEKRFNNGNSLPEKTNELKQWLKENRDKMLDIETLNKESTPEHKIAIIDNKISNNKTTLDELFKEKNIEPNSEIGLELLKIYNDTHDKLKLELENLKIKDELKLKLEELKTQVVDIATNDFNSL